MSYTINQQPLEYTPAYNDHVYVVSSSNYLQPNFRYIAKVYVGGDIITIKQVADPTYTSCYFRLSKTIESLVSHDISKTDYGFTLCPNSIKSYYVEFYEEYDIAGVLTESILKATGNTIKIWNGVIDFLNYQSYNYTGYTLDASTHSLNHSLKREIETGQYAWIYLLAKDLLSAKYAIIRTYNAANTLIQSVGVANPYQTDATLGHHLVKFGCGTANLNLIPALLVGSQPIITASVASYGVYFSDTGEASGSFDSEVYNFKVVSSDCIHETFRLHYLNSLGAFESVNFMKASKHSQDIKTESYKKVSGGLTGATTYGYSTSDINEVNYTTTIKDKYHVRTNWLTTDNQNVLEQLVSSPVVFWDNPTFGIVSINIENKNFEFMKTVTKKMFSLEIDFTMSYDRYRQRY